MLEKHLPPGAAEALWPHLQKHPLQLIISRPRKTKLGDYRFPRPGKPHHSISINCDLNPYAFLITLLHELAHLEAFLAHGRDIKPHGLEWQAAFRQISTPFLNEKYFPAEIVHAFRQSLHRGVASSCTDLKLFAVLKKYDPARPENSLLVSLEELPTGARFYLNNKVMIKGARQRIRYTCRDTVSGRYYRVHPLAEVLKIEDV